MLAMRQVPRSVPSLEGNDFDAYGASSLKYPLASLRTGTESRVGTAPRSR